MPACQISDMKFCLCSCICELQLYVNKYEAKYTSQIGRQLLLFCTLLKLKILDFVRLPRLELFLNLKQK